MSVMTVNEVQKPLRQMFNSSRFFLAFYLLSLHLLAPLISSHHAVPVYFQCVDVSSIGTRLSSAHTVSSVCFCCICRVINYVLTKTFTFELKQLVT